MVKVNSTINGFISDISWRPVGYNHHGAVEKLHGAGQ